MLTYYDHSQAFLYLFIYELLAYEIGLKRISGSRNYGDCNNGIMELSYQGTFVPGNESSIGGTFVPGNFRSWEPSFPGTFVPWNFRPQE